MPELPEVETIRRVLRHNLINETILDIQLSYQPLLEKDSPYPIDQLMNRRITDVLRRGKYLIFELDESLYWIVHLRMEGKFHLYDNKKPPTKHTHLTFETGHHYVHYLDTRKFSRMSVTNDLSRYFERKHLGLEPFDDALTVDYLKNKFKNRTMALKGVLLDQSVIAGIGNIYADEILFLSKLHPESNPSLLDDSDLECIIENTKSVLSKAIDEGGTTIRSYTSSLGVTGRFQVSLNAYGRGGEMCLVCGETMQKIKVVQRGTVFCEKCQRLVR